MAKFYGPVGFAESVETVPGVWEDVITERNLFGDVERDNRKLDSGEKLNYDISVGNVIRVVADAYALEHFFAIRYIKWAGAYWAVTSVDVLRPRLLLRLGGVYNGPKVSPPEPPDGDFGDE